LELEAVAFLLACAAAGFAITYVLGVPFSFEERVVFGAVLGPAAVAAFSFVPSLVVRDVTVFTVLCGLAAAWVVGGIAAFGARAQLAADWADTRRRWLSPLRVAGHPWPLLAVLIVCGAWTVHFFHQAYVYTPQGLYAGYVNIWGDWAAHLSFAGSFAYGHNFPPEFPIDPGHRLGYPFMVDFFASDLVPAGLSLTEALTATSAMLALAFPGVLYLVALRFTAGRGAAAIAVFVFLLSGGLGFVYLVGDLHRNGLAALVHLQREYTLNRDVDLQWLNPVLAYLVPQRSTLFGFSLALLLLLVLWMAVRERLGWRPFFVAGVIAGVMPAFHVHAYGTVVALGALWSLFNMRRQWLAFFVPALALGVPMLLWLWPSSNTSICGGSSIGGYCLQPGWLAFPIPDSYGPLRPLLFLPDVAAFWLWNTSLLLPLIVAGHALRRWFPTRFPTWFAPMWLWFVVPNFIVLQPWIWDNTKFFIFWALLGSVVVGGVLAGMLRFHRATAILAVVFMGVLGLSGLLDVTRASDFSVSAVQFTDSGGLRVAEWVRQNTSPTALFVVADEHNSPIPTLAGRRVLVGYPGWLWTYGLSDYALKGEDSKRILDGDPATPALVRHYGVDYVMIGPQEVPRGASRAYWDEHGTKVYDDGLYTVYRVKR
jgi:hypothetical protein